MLHNRRPDFDEATHPLVAYARAHGLQIVQVAETLGISPGYCAQIMERWKAPSRDLIFRIVQVYGIEAEILLSVPLRPKKKRTQ